MKKCGNSDVAVENNRRVFLARYGVVPEQAVLVGVSYEADDFCRYRVIDEKSRGEGMVRDGHVADALATQAKNVALFLPLADCGGVTIFDPKNQALMLSHLGRHSLEQNGGQKSVEFMQKQFGSNPAELIIDISPVAAREQYPLYAFANRGIGEIIIEQLITAGVELQHITQPFCYTTSDKRYFSHSNFLAGKQAVDGRFAVVAMMTD